MDIGGNAAAEFGRLLHRHRRQAGLTQEELAERSGLSVRAISDMERGKARGPQQRSVEAIGEALALAGGDLKQFVMVARSGRVRKPAVQIGLCELPADLPDMIGRSDERAWISALTDGLNRSNAHAATVAVISGQPGVGKTTLAVRAAYELAQRFPGGVYFVDLRGADQNPISSSAVLERLLRSMGVAESAVPRELDERASLFRSVVARKPVLTVLDNAHDEAQVRPLLAGSGDCLQIVTSRRTLTGLEAVHRLDLGVLPTAEAVQLLESAAGTEHSGQQGVLDVAELCGYLPLALRIAGNRLAVRRQLTVTGLVDLLADHRRRLSVLAAGDLQIRAVFEVSYQQLSPTARGVFRRLSLAPEQDFGAGLTGAVSGLDEFDALLALDELAEASMLTPSAHEDRYRFHDLLRLFARERLAQEESEQDSRAAEDAMCDWLVAGLAAAGERLNPDRPDSSDALLWLDAEAGNWLHALRREAAHGRHKQVAAAVRALHWYSDVRALSYRWDQIFALGLDSARAAGNHADEAILLSYLCWAQWAILADDTQALQTGMQALELAREVGDRKTEGWALSYAALIHRRLGNHQDAADYARESVATFADIGYDTGLNIARGILGHAMRVLGRIDEALSIRHEQLAYYERTRTQRSDTLGDGMRAQVHRSMGEDHATAGNWSESLVAYAESAQLSARSGNRSLLGVALRGQGTVLLQMGRSDEAVKVLTEAIDIVRESLNQHWEVALVMQILGEAVRDAGDPQAAIGWWEQALQLCDAMGGHPRSVALSATLRELLATTRLAYPA